MIHKRIYLILIISIFLSPAFGQTNSTVTQDQRTLKTKVADILTEMPAQDKGHLKKLMGEMLGFGEPGLIMLTDMLQEPGGDDDSKVRFALNGFAYYITQTGHEQHRKTFNSAIIKALKKSESDYLSSFLISMLQITGKDDVIPHLGSLLTDDFLYEPATRALVSIGSSESENTLLQALKDKPGYVQISIVKALGDLRTAKAVKDITKLAGTDDEDLHKVILYALANIGSIKSADILFEAANEIGFKYSNTGATQSYMLFLKRLGENRILDELDSRCQYLLENAPPNIRIQALSLMIQFESNNPRSLILDAIDDPDPNYRAAARELTKRYQGKEFTSALINKLDEVSPAIQAEIIETFGAREDETSIPTLIASLENEDHLVRLSAITALALLEGEDAIQPLFKVMSNGIPVEVDAIKKILLSLDNDEVASEIYALMNDQPNISKAALFEVLTYRDPDGFYDMAIEETKNPDTDIRIAAYSALAHLAEAKDAEMIYQLFKIHDDPFEEDAILNTVLLVAKRLNEQDQTRFLNMFSDLDFGKKALLHKILVEIGSKKALSLVLEDYYSGDDIKSSAFDVLCQWKNLEVLHHLYTICIDEDHDYFRGKATDRYYDLVKRSRIPAEQKVLLYRKLIVTDCGKQMIKEMITDLGSFRIFQALLLAGSYLDDPDLQQDAARAVIKIALPSNGKDDGMTGPVVAKLISKADNVLSGEEDQQIKQNARAYLGKMNQVEGFVPLFNGKDLTGWQGLVKNPIARAKMDPDTLKMEQAEANKRMHECWSVKDGVIWFNGKGANLCTIKKYGDFELIVDWKITKGGDSGLYLRGTPQVQIWDTSRTNVGAQVGSGGLYNNQNNPSKPMMVADNLIGDWNTFKITMVGEKVSVWLNGQLVVDNVILENYWDRNQPIFPIEQIELQAHGSNLGFRDIYIREIERTDHNKLTGEEEKEGFVQLFNGKDLTNWTGNTTDYVVEDGIIVIYPYKGEHGNLYTEKEYADFNFRFEFQLTPGANNGLGIRTPMEGNPAYVGMELQILDNTAPIYRELEQWQYHGSVYGVIPAKRGFLKPVGEWNSEEVIIKGSDIKIILNGNVIVDGNLEDASRNGTIDGNDHPGLKRTTGHIGFLGHGSIVKFRNIRIKEL